MRGIQPGLIILSVLFCLITAGLILSGQDPLSSAFAGLIVAMILAVPVACLCGLVVAVGLSVAELVPMIPTRACRYQISRSMKWASLWVAFRLLPKEEVTQK